MSDFIEAAKLKKSFDGGSIKALDGVSTCFSAGEFVSIMGPSGSGKSTFLYMLGGLDRPDSGSLTVGGRDIFAAKDLTAFRAQTIGFVFQLHNLIPSQTVLENVILPMYEGPLLRKERRVRAMELLARVGIQKRMGSYPTQLSGGERQRVAIARALANSPEIILADEPTGSLDSKSSNMIMELLTDIWRSERKTLILITHEESIGRRAGRIIRMLDGRIESEEKTHR